jgi:hypothetical protein
MQLKCNVTLGAGDLMPLIMRKLSLCDGGGGGRRCSWETFTLCERDGCFEYITRAADEKEGCTAKQKTARARVRERERAAVAETRHQRALISWWFYIHAGRQN